MNGTANSDGGGSGGAGGGEAGESIVELREVCASGSGRGGGKAIAGTESEAIALKEGMNVEKRFVSRSQSMEEGVE